MSINPYDSPTSYTTTPAATDQHERPIGMLPHVPVLASFMIFQGGISVLFGVMMAGFSLLMPALIMQADGGDPPPGMDPESFGIMMFAVYFGMSVVVGLPGLIVLWAGIQLLKFKGRVLSMVALGLGLVSGLICYCLPSGIALLIYGLIVLNNEQVRTAFDLRSDGNTWRQVMRYFYGQTQTAK